MLLPLRDLDRFLKPAVREALRSRVNEAITAGLAGPGWRHRQVGRQTNLEALDPDEALAIIEKPRRRKSVEATIEERALIDLQARQLEPTDELSNAKEVRLRKWGRRLADYQRKAKKARKVVRDRAKSIAPDESRHVDLDAGVIREREEEGPHPALERAGIDNGSGPEV